MKKTYYVNVGVKCYRGGRLKVAADSPEEAAEIAIAWSLWEGRGCDIVVYSVKEKEASEK